MDHAIGLDIYDTQTEKGLVAATDGANAMLTMGLRTPITASVIERLPQLRIIARYGVGVDNTDVTAATEHAVLVTNAPTYCSSEIADHTVALILALGRQIVALDGFVRAGHWDSSIQLAGPLFRFSTLTLGLVGFGSIGREVAQRARRLAGEIVDRDPLVEPDLATAHDVRLVSLDSLLAEADGFRGQHMPRRGY